MDTPEIEIDHGYMKPTPENLALVALRPSERYVTVRQEAQTQANDIATKAARIANLLNRATTRAGLERAEALMFEIEQDMNALRLELESIR